MTRDAGGPGGSNGSVLGKLGAYGCPERSLHHLSAKESSELTGTGHQGPGEERGTGEPGVVKKTSGKRQSLGTAGITQRL